MASRELIVDILSQLISSYKTRSEKKFQIKALNNAVEALNKHNVDIILSGAYALENIKGIGKGIAQRIDEIISTGSLKELCEDVQRREVVTEFMKITGVGEKRASDFYEQGFRTIDQLKNISHSHHISLGLKYFDDFQQRIPRDEMNHIVDLIKTNLKTFIEHNNLIIEFCGSYRRNASTCGDIDILITMQPNFDNNLLEIIVKKLSDSGILIDHLTTNGEKKYMGVCKTSMSNVARRIDIRYIPYASFYPALIYFTGSKNFNIAIRNRALELGYSLSEYGFLHINDNVIITVNSEEELFNMLQMSYVLPCEREI